MIIHRPESMDLFEPVETPLWVPDDRGRPYNPKGYIIPPEYLLGNLKHPHPLWRKLAENAVAKKMTRIFVPELDSILVTPEVVSDLRLAYLGESGRSIYSMNRGPDCKYMAPSTGGLPDGELGKEYLKACMKAADGKVYRGSRRYKGYLDILPARYYEPGPYRGRHRGNFAYIDLSSAYWTIQQTATIDMAFIPGRWLGLGRGTFRDVEEVTRYRDLRHIVPGLLRSGSIEKYVYGRVVNREMAGEYYHPEIHGYTMHIMHAIARHMIDHFDAKMILVDAFIIPEENTEAAMEFLPDVWGVRGVVKGRGEGSLYGQNIYSLPGKSTKHAPSLWTTAHSWKYASPDGRIITITPDSSRVNDLIKTDIAWLHNRRAWVISKGLGKETLCDTR